MLNRREFLGTVPALGLGAPAAEPEVSTSTAPRLVPALCAYSFADALKARSMSYPDLLKLAAGLQIGAADLTVYWFPDTSDEFLLPLKRLAYSLAVDLYSIGVRTEMTQPTPELRLKEAAAIRKWVDVAVKLGARHVRVFGGNVPKGATEDQSVDWAVEVLARASEYAGSKGVILGLENHGGITERAERVLEIVRKVGSPWVGINLDTGNFTARVYEQIEACIPYAVNVHMKAEMTEDGRRAPADWERIAGLFAKHNYRGHLDLEYESEEPAAAAVPKLLTRLKQVCAKHTPGAV